MRRSFLVAALVLVSLGALAAEVTTLKLKGVHCPMGAKAVEKALASVPGVTGARVDLKKAEAEVTFDESKTGVDAMVAAVRKSGYEAEAAESHGCPLVGDRAVDDFHKVLHKMHTAVRDGRESVLKDYLPEMKAKRDALVRAFGQVAKHARTEAEKNPRRPGKPWPRTLSRSVDALDSAVNDKARPAVDKAFEKVHGDFYKILGALDAEKADAQRREEGLASWLWWLFGDAVGDGQEDAAATRGDGFAFRYRQRLRAFSGEDARILEKGDLFFNLCRPGNRDPTPGRPLKPVPEVRLREPTFEPPPRVRVPAGRLNRLREQPSRGPFRVRRTGPRGRVPRGSSPRLPVSGCAGLPKGRRRDRGTRGWRSEMPRRQRYRSLKGRACASAAAKRMAGLIESGISVSTAETGRPVLAAISAATGPSPHPTSRTRLRRERRADR